jgi:hypothetical protein
MWVSRRERYVRILRCFQADLGSLNIALELPNRLHEGYGLGLLRLIVNCFVCAASEFRQMPSLRVNAGGPGWISTCFGSKHLLRLEVV